MTRGKAAKTTRAAALRLAHERRAPEVMPRGPPGPTSMPEGDSPRAAIMLRGYDPTRLETLLPALDPLRTLEQAGFRGPAPEKALRGLLPPDL